MKKSAISIIFILTLILSFESLADTLIINHTVVDLYDNIPQQWIDSVKTMWATVPGESHGRGYRIGLYLLDSLDNRFAVNIQESGTPEGPTDLYLRFSSATKGDVRGITPWWTYGYGEEDWFTTRIAIENTKATLTYCDTAGPALTAMGFGWCWDMTSPGPTGEIDPVHQTRWGGRSYYWNGSEAVDAGAWGLNLEDTALTGNTQGISMDTYLQATQEYIDLCTNNGYITKVFFTTGPIDGSSEERAYQRYLKHEYIRDYVNASNDCILFDYADILSWSDAGDENTQNWTDYDGTPHTFQYIHSDNMLDLDGTYAEDGDHIGQRGALRLGKAMWYMLARIAGWDGDTISGIIEEITSANKFYLLQNTPNPFNLSTTIYYFIPSEENIELAIYDKSGYKIRSLVNGVVPKGFQNVEWDGTDKEGKRVSSGTYFYQIRWENGKSYSKKMIFLR